MPPQSGFVVVSIYVKSSGVAPDLIHSLGTDVDFREN